MSNGSHLSPDFVGYDVGIPVDTTPTAGFVGFVDFTGIPVGLPAFTPPTPTPTGNHKGGGTIINVYEHIDPLKRKRRREDEEILLLKGV
jgi:hypothetical protein